MAQLAVGEAFIIASSLRSTSGDSFGCFDGGALAGRYGSAQVCGPVVVDSIVGNKRGNALFKSRGAGCKVAAQADPHERDSLGVATGEVDGEVNDGSYYVFPLGTEGEAFSMDGPVLTGAVKRENVVTPLDGRLRRAVLRRIRRSQSAL
jgi:hypothetical protein